MPPLNRFERSCIALAVGQAVASSPAHAASYTAANAAQLISAVQAANATVAADTITLTADIEFTEGFLNSPTNPFTALPFVETEITIEGNGHSVSRADSAPDFRLFTSFNTTSIAGVGDLSLSNVTVQNGRFSGDNEFAGACIYVGEGASLSVTGSTVTLCNGVSSGGAIVNKGNVSVINSTISSSSAFLGGGIFSNATSTLSLLDSRIANNQSQSSGGGIYNSRTALVEVQGTTISNNTSGGDGGGIFTSRNAILEIQNSTISGNVAGLGSGGAIYANRGEDITITDSQVVNNSSYYVGGGLAFSDNRFISISRSRIRGNSSTQQSAGGLFANSNASLRMNEVTVSGNSSFDGGGGMLISDSTNVTLTRITVSNNVASGSSRGTFGGGISVLSSTTGSSEVSISESTFSANLASRGGALCSRFNGSIVEITGVTISDNSATLVGAGGGLNSAGGVIYVRNSIIANSYGGDDCATNAGLDFDTTSIVEDADCPAARFEDPKLLPLDNNGGFGRTHALAPASIARNTADVGICPAEDQRGKPRFGDDDPFCDVGAIEFDPADGASLFVIPLGSGKSVTVPL